MLVSNDVVLIEKLLLDSDDHSLNGLSNIFGKEANNKENGFSEGARDYLRLLGKLTSMVLVAGYVNEPFHAQIQLADGRRSALPEDFTSEDLEQLTNNALLISFKPLAARISDLLWLCIRPKNKDHAIRAIDNYIDAEISPKMWTTEGEAEYERAYRLAKSINCIDRVGRIEQLLLAAFNNLECSDIAFSLAELIDRLGALKPRYLEIAGRLENLGKIAHESQQYHLSIRIFELGSRLYRRTSNEEKYVELLFLAAKSHDQNAELHFSSQIGSKLIAAGLFQNAIHAYRRIPNKYREEYSIENCISSLRDKLAISGTVTLNEMGIIRTPVDDANEMIALSIEHVGGKKTEYEALIFLSYIRSIPNFAFLEQTANEQIREFFLSSLFDSVQYSRDGRVIGKSPGLGFNPSPENRKIALHAKMVKSFSTEIDLIVRLSIVPSLQKILSEHAFSRSFIYELCDRSPIVPKENINLIARAIWLGLEWEFSTAIYLIAPQIEALVRSQFKRHGAHTTNIDKNGIEHENGLSALLDMPEADSILGPDFRFELVAVFADSFGSNLRNEVAHGLLSDSAAHSAAPIYGWWMLLRMVVHSTLRELDVVKDTEEIHESN